MLTVHQFGYTALLAVAMIAGAVGLAVLPDHMPRINRWRRRRARRRERRAGL